MTDHLRTLAKTALLCGVLGLLLYGAVVQVAAVPGAHLWLGLILAGIMAAITGHQVLTALRTGQFPLRGPPLLRDRQPIQYWVSVAWFGASTIALAGIALGCAWALFAGRA